MKTIIFILLMIIAASCSTTSEIRIYEAPGESIQQTTPLESTAYPIEYEARLIGHEGKIELREKNPTNETNNIIHIERIFKMQRFCIMPKDEVPGEWQKFVVTSPLFWTKFHKPDVQY
jgi:hypothetical protein